MKKLVDENENDYYYNQVISLILSVILFCGAIFLTDNHSFIVIITIAILAWINGAIWGILRWIKYGSYNYR